MTEKLVRWNGISFTTMDDKVKPFYS